MDKQSILQPMYNELGGELVNSESAFQQNMQAMMEEKRRKLLEEAQRRSAIEAAATVKQDTPVPTGSGEVSRWNPFVWMFGHPSDVGKE